MKRLEIYTGEKVYMFPNGAIGTREAVLKSFPAALDFKFVVTTDENGEVMWGMDNLSAMRSHYGIDASLSVEEAVAAIEEIINTPEVVDDMPSPDERIAAALEYQVLMSMPDEEEEV